MMKKLVKTAMIGSLGAIGILTQVQCQSAGRPTDGEVSSNSVNPATASTGSLTEDPKDCIFNPSDAYEPRTRIAKGPFAGRCVDTRSKRTIARINSPSETRFIKVRDVRHQQKFWFADIDLEGIENASIMVEYFPAAVPAAHAMIRLDFSTPVKLVNQLDPKDTTELTTLITSIEASGGLDYKYDLVNGIKEHFIEVFRIESLPDRIDWSINLKKHRIDILPMKLKKSEIAAYFRAYVAKASEVGYSYIYNTILSNCANEQFKLIDQVVNYSLRENVQRKFTFFAEVYPVVIQEALRARALWSPKDPKVPSLLPESAAQ
jgi:Domain of unknown function (DUF4105)